MRLAIGVALFSAGWVVGPLVAAAVGAASPWAGNGPARAIAAYASEPVYYLPRRAEHADFTDHVPAQECGYSRSLLEGAPFPSQEPNQKLWGYSRLIDVSAWLDRHSSQTLQAWQLEVSASEFELNFLANCMSYTAFSGLCRRRVSHHLAKDSGLDAMTAKVLALARTNGKYVICRYLDGIAYRKGVAIPKDRLATTP
jgi:hypothetical protein